MVMMMEVHNIVARNPEKKVPVNSPAQNTPSPTFVPFCAFISKFLPVVPSKIQNGCGILKNVCCARSQDIVSKAMQINT